MNVKEAAAYVGMTERTLYRWLKQGRLVGKNVDGRWEFSANDLEAALMGTAPAARPPMPTTRGRGLAGLPPGLQRQFQDFVEDTLRSLSPRNVIVLDRKGARAFEALAPSTDYEWGRNVWHDSVLECLPERALREMAAAGPFYVFDEMMQRGRAFKRIRDRLESVGATVGTFALVGRRDLFLLGQVEDPKVQVCLDLEGPDFSRLVSKLSGALSVVSWPMDVDHVSAIGKINVALGIEELIARASEFGRVAVVPTEGDGNRIGALSLDRPQYFDTSCVANWTSATVDWRGPCKIRFHFDQESATFAATAMAYPSINFKGDAAELLASSQGLLSTQTLAYLEGLDAKSIARLLYLAYSASVSAELLRQTRDAGVFEALGLECPPLADGVDASSFIAALGPWLGNRVFERATSTLLTCDDQPRLPMAPEPTTRVPWSTCEPWTGDSVDVEACRNQLMRVLSRAPRPQAWPEVAWTDILSELSGDFAEGTTGAAIDWLVDQGPVKPVVIVTQTDDSFVVERGGRRGEFGPWFDHAEGTLYHYDTQVRQTLSLSAALTQRALDNQSKKTGGVNSLQFAKLVVNLEHDWDSERMGGPLFAGWWPYLHGPVPVIPISRQPGGGYHLLAPYAVGANYLVEKRYGSGRQLVPADTSALDWRREYDEVFDPLQRLVIESLADEYLEIERSLPSRRNASKNNDPFYMDPLASLAAARNQRLAYICGHGEVAIWLAEGADVVWPSLRASLAGSAVDLTRVKVLMERFARPLALLRQKLDDYGVVHELKARLSELADEHQRPALRKILETIDDAPIFDERPPYPLAALQRGQEIASDYTSMLRSRLSAAGITVDTRKTARRVAADGSTKDANYYWRRLIKSCPELGPLASEMETITRSDGALTAEDLDVLRAAFFVIRDLLSDEDFLPDPMAASHRVARSTHYGGYMSLVQGLRLPNSAGLLVADIRNFMRLGSLAAFLHGEEGTAAEERARDMILATATQGVLEVAGKFSALICERFSDTFILAFEDAEALMRAAKAIQIQTSDWVRTYDNRQSVPLSLLRFGADWFEKSEKALTDSNSWIAAYAACEHNRLDAGQILVTPRLHERLPESMRAAFAHRPDATFLGVLPEGGFVGKLGGGQP